MKKSYWIEAGIIVLAVLVLFWPLGLILAFALFGIVPMVHYIKEGKEAARNREAEPQAGENDEKEILPIANAYQKKWLFSYNEKHAYYRLKEIAEPMGLTVFAKVRLLDLLEPVKGTPKYKTYFYKVQAKHVDFVLCDSKLVARYIIELDDSSHDEEPRKERDAFVDEVVKSVGYKIIHTRAITDEIRKELQE